MDSVRLSITNAIRQVSILTEKLFSEEENNPKIIHVHYVEYQSFKHQLSHQEETIKEIPTLHIDGNLGWY